MITDNLHTCCIDGGDNYYPSHCRVGEPEQTRTVAITTVMVSTHHSHESDESSQDNSDCQHHHCSELKIESCDCQETHNSKSTCKFWICSFHCRICFCFLELFPIENIIILLLNVNINIIENIWKFDLINILDYTLYSIYNSW